MTDPQEHPLDPDVLSALRVERERPSPDAAARARVTARLAASVLVDASPHRPGADGSRPGRLLSGLRHASPAALVGGGFAAGLVAGVVLQAAIVRAPTSTVHPTETSAAVPSSAISLTTPAAAPSPPAPPIEVPSPAAPSASAPSVPAAATLAAERALLDAAHAALGRGEPSAALETLTQHSERFSHGTYREEREALTIQCLEKLGRHDEARTRALRFRARYPKSLFLPTIEGAIENL
jgi:hypothetical protein